MEKSDKMDWMYKGPAALVDRDDYLTGRSVDKALKLLDETEKGNTFSYLDEVEKDLTPVSIFASRGPQGAVDVIRKIKEDPLFKIQKQEEERLRELLDNPVRLKKLKELAEKNKEAGPSTSSSVSKTDRQKQKPRKRANSSTSDSDSDEGDAHGDIDKLLAQKLQYLKNPKDILLQAKKSRRDSSSEDDRRKRTGIRDQPQSSRYGRSSRSARSRSRSRSRERSSGSRNREYNQKNRSIEARERRNDRYSRNDDRHGPTSKRSAPSKPSIDDEERERRLREMMENSKWRDTQRTKNVEKHRSEVKREEDMQKSKKDAEFIRKQLVEAATKGSVAQRIKSNSYNIQRSSSSMDHNFAKR